MSPYKGHRRHHDNVVFTIVAVVAICKFPEKKFLKFYIRILWRSLLPLLDLKPILMDVKLKLRLRKKKKINLHCAQPWLDNEDYKSCSNLGGSYHSDASFGCDCGESNIASTRTRKLWASCYCFSATTLERSLVGMETFRSI